MFQDIIRDSRYRFCMQNKNEFPHLCYLLERPFRKIHSKPMLTDVLLNIGLKFAQKVQISLQDAYNLI